VKITVFHTACLVVCAGAAVAQEVRIQADAFERAERAFRESRIPEARELYAEACRTVVEQGSPDLPECLLKMGMLASMAGDLSEALPLLTKARTLCEPDSIAGENVLYQLAILYDELGRYSEAADVAGQAEASARAVLGDNHPDTILATSLHGALLAKIGKLESGEQLAKRALEAARRVTLPAIDLAGVQSRLALVLAYKGDFTEAASLLRKNLDMISATFGDDHVLVASQLLRLAALYRQSGNVARAMPLSRRAGYLYRKARVPATWEATSDLEEGVEALQARQPRLAANILGHGLKIISERKLDGAGLDLISSLRFYLAEAYIELRDYLAAEPLLLGAIEQEKLRDPFSETLAFYLATLGKLHAAAKRPQTAAALYEQSVSLFEERHRDSAQYPKVLTAYANLIKNQNPSRSKELKRRIESTRPRQ
jgi:tetratricopeptide (TPR) repeat protein